MASPHVFQEKGAFNWKGGGQEPGRGRAVGAGGTRSQQTFRRILFIHILEFGTGYGTYFGPLKWLAFVAMQMPKIKTAWNAEPSCGGKLPRVIWTHNKL